VLQRTLLPQALPSTSGLAMAGHYEPGSSSSVAGGDFYDAFTVPDGRVALVVGDVVGRGLAAATVMGQVRAAARGAALSGASPAQVMASLDRLVTGLDAFWPSTLAPGGTEPMRAGYGGELFVTMLYALLDPRSGDLELVNAGHCCPAVVRGWDPPARETPEPVVELLDLPVGPPLGLCGEWPVHRARLAVGDLFLGFTDGLVERRGRSVDEGEAWLRDLLSSIVAVTPRALCQQVLQHAAAEGGLEDDCAVLAVARPAAAHRTATLVIPPEPRAVAPARHWARRQLQEWQLGDEVSFVVVTGLSELVTNAVLHAATEARVTLDLDDRRITVSVTDSGNRGAPRALARDVTSQRGRGLSLVRSMSDSFGTHRSALGSDVWFDVLLEREPAATETA
jgi:anti-sigma regulatory factor (Ser/Thr protein kinase)